MPPAPPAAGRTRRFLLRWSGPLAIAATAGVMLCWTWGTWPDVLIDFGAQLYVPWQLAHGRVLYRDIAHYNGPLSQYLNALVFQLFGPALYTLVLFNLLLLAGLLVLLYEMLRQVAERWSAIVGCLVFVLLFAFAQFVGIGNYNYVCPYAHEMTHGLMLSLLALVSVWQYPRWGLAAAAVGGLALGLAFLTKAEVFLGGAAGVAVAVGLTAWYETASRRRRVAIPATLTAGALLPPLLAFAGLCLAMPPSKALAGTLGSWVVAVKPEVTHLRFFREGLGVADPSESLRALLLGAAGYAAALAIPCALALGARRICRYPRVLAATVFAATALAAKALGSHIPWFGAARPLPLILLLCGTVLALLLVRRRADAEDRQHLIRQISLVVFAFAMLGKMILNTRIVHYGFVLAMPATMVLVVTLLGWVPTAIDRAGGVGAVFGAAALALLGVAASAHLTLQSRCLALKTYKVGTGADAFWADARGPFVNRALEELARRAAPEDTLTCMPTGIMINYLAKRRTPVRYQNFGPTEVFQFGEEAMLSDFEAHPPDWIVVIHQEASEFGLRVFGQDYARQIGAWGMGNYQPVVRIGAPPLSGTEFGIGIFRKKDSPERRRGRDQNRPAGRE